MRSEEEIVAGVVRIRLGGRTPVTIDMPDRTVDETTEWQVALAQQVGGVVTPDLASPDAAMGLLSRIGAGIHELIVSYDTSGQVSHDLLGRSTPAQVYEAFRTVLEAVYPYVRDVQSAISILRPLLNPAGAVAVTAQNAGQQPGAPSTNGRSRPGARTPAKSGAG